MSKESFYSNFRSKKIKLIQHLPPNELKNQNKISNHLSKINIPKYNKSINGYLFLIIYIENDCTNKEKVKLRSTSSFNTKMRIENNTIRLNGILYFYF